MPDTYINENLSFTDAFFLYLEQPGAPVNVASISAFEGDIPLDICRDYVESKLPLIPRFLQRVVTAPLGLGPPTWQFDPHFDVRNHVREVTLKRGSEAEWKSSVSQVLSINLDRRHPLWDLTLFRGLKGGRTGVVVRCHHCLVDGVAGVGILKVLLDQNATPSPIPPKKRRTKLPPTLSPGSALLDGLISCCFSAAQALLTAHSELLRLAGHPAQPNGNAHNAIPSENLWSSLGRIATLGELAKLLTELARPTERLPFNVLCRGPQLFDWAELPMSELVGVKDACEAKLNEVVLAVLTDTLQRYAELHSLKLKGRRLRLVVPVDVRCEGEASGTGNHITFLPVDITLGTRDPRKLLSLVQRRVAFSKTAHGFELVGLIAVLASALPPTLQSLAGSYLSQLPISVCNSICTNVHGPSTPLYLLGHKMLSSYPYVPIGGEMGMNCAVLSYNGSLFVGFTGDAQAIPDLSQLPKFFNESFAELRAAVGVPIARKVSSNKPRAPRPRPSRSKLNNPPQEITVPTAFEAEVIPVESAAVAASAGVR